jgi:ABC-type phosphate transport system substrate-binding protein
VKGELKMRMRWILPVFSLVSFGGCEEWDWDHSIVPLLGRDESSGTRTYFQERVMGGEAYSPRVETLPGTEQLVETVMEDQRAIGYGGVAYLKGVRPLRVKKDDASPGVSPTPDAIASGAYPITRSLYFYTVGKPDGLARAFIGWVRGTQGQKICSEVGYVPLPEAQRTAKPAPAPAGKQGLRVKGSDTLRILSIRWAQAYTELNPDCSIQVIGGGSELGIAALRDGQVEICQASRPLTPQEKEEIKAKRGKSPEEFPVALDGLAVFVNEQNPLQEISFADLRRIYTGQISRWGDVGRPGQADERSAP